MSRTIRRYYDIRPEGRMVAITPITELEILVPLQAETPVPDAPDDDLPEPADTPVEEPPAPEDDPSQPQEDPA